MSITQPNITENTKTLKKSQYMFGCVYKITNKINGKIYIGQTIRKPEVRWKYHTNPPKNVKKLTYIQSAIQKYGVDNFDFETICYAKDRDSLNYYEDHFIQYFNCLAPKGYTCIGSRSVSGMFSQETLNKMSLAKKGKEPWNKGKKYKLSEDSKTAYKLSNKGKWLGKKQSSESKIKMSLAKKGKRFLSDEHYERVGLINSQRVVSEETRAKLSAANMGKVHSRHVLDAMAEKKTRNVIVRIDPNSGETKNYYSGIELKNDGFRYSSVYRSITKFNGQIKHKGYYWNFIPKGDR